MKSKRKRGFFKRNKKKKASDEDSLAAEESRRRAKSNAGIKKKRGLFNGLFKTRKKKQRAKTLENNGREVSEILAGRDGEDLIDQLYKSTKQGIEQNQEHQNSGFASYNPKRVSGMNNFTSFGNSEEKKEVNNEQVASKKAEADDLKKEPHDSSLKPSKTEPDDMQVNTKEPIPAESAPKKKGLSQSIRSLLTGDENRTEKEEQSEGETKVGSSVAGSDSGQLNTEQILKSQYEEDTSNEEEEDIPEKINDDKAADEVAEQSPSDAEVVQEPIKPESEEPVEVEIKSETKPKSSKLQDFLNSLESESEDGKMEEEVQEEPALPDPTPPEKDIEPALLPPPPPKSPKRVKRRVVRDEDKPLKVSPTTKVKGKSETVVGREGDKSKDIDRIVEGLSFKIEEPEVAKVDVEKIKAEIRSEIKAEMEKDTKALEEVEKLKAGQLEMQKALKEEQRIKDELNVELQQLKENLLKETKEKQVETEGKETKLIEKLLAQNEKQLQNIQEIVKEAATKEYSTVPQKPQKVEPDQTAYLAAREELELKRIEQLTNQIKLEQSLILQEEERKQAFELMERERLKNFDGSASLLDQYEVKQLSQDPMRTSPSFSLFNQSQESFVERVSGLIEEKLHSPHFFDAFQLLMLFCLFILSCGVLSQSFLIRAIFGSDKSTSTAELGWIPVVTKFDLSISNLMSLMCFQFFHTTYNQLLANVGSLFKVSSIFLITDKQPAIIREIFLCGYISTLLVVVGFSALPFISVSGLSGISSLVYSMTTHIISRGWFSNGSLERLVSILMMIACFRSALFALSNPGELPFLIAGCSSGLITSYMANGR